MGRVSKSILILLGTPKKGLTERLFEELQFVVSHWYRSVLAKDKFQNLNDSFQGKPLPRILGLKHSAKGFEKGLILIPHFEK